VALARGARIDRIARRRRVSPASEARGIVRSINVERGFGFIETTTGDLFFPQERGEGRLRVVTSAREWRSSSAKVTAARAEDISAV
jgi:hypothetical protein